MPPNDQLIQIVTTWFYRLWEISSDPTAHDASYICLAGTDCAQDYGGQIDDVRAQGMHVEGAEPPTVKIIRFVESTGDGGFMVSVLTNPTQAGTLVGPDGFRDERTSSPNGLGATLLFAPFPDDSKFPWRATQYIEDP